MGDVGVFMGVFKTHLPCQLYPPQTEIFHKVAARLVLQKVVKVGARPSLALGEVAGAGLSGLGNAATEDVMVYLAGDNLQQRQARLMAQHELTLVIALAIAQQRGDKFAQERGAETVDAPLQLALYVVQTALHGAQLAGRQMEGLGGFVFKIGEIAQFLGQEKAAEERGMEDEHAATGARNGMGR